MLFNVIRQLNWVDIVVALVFARILYVSAKNGFVVEFFKLSGIILAIYVSLHYYTGLSSAITERFLPNVPAEFMDFIVFIVLAGLSYSLFILLRLAILNFIKMEAAPTLSKWGGFAIGFGRGILTASLIASVLYVSNTGYLNKSVWKSYWGSNLFGIAINTYSGLWEGLTSKFMTAEKFNKAVLEIQKEK